MALLQLIVFTVYKSCVDTYVIARDIPVFREVAGEHAYYFNGLDPQVLADTLKNWLTLRAENKAPQSNDMPWLTWNQSTRQLLAALLPNSDILKKLLSQESLFQGSGCYRYVLASLGGEY